MSVPARGLGVGLAPIGVTSPRRRLKKGGWGRLLLLLEVSKVGEKLSKNDQRILEAILMYGNASAAARALAPDRPSYRGYIARRLRYFESLVSKVMDQTILGCLAQEATRRGRSVRGSDDREGN